MEAAVADGRSNLVPEVPEAIVRLNVQDSMEKSLEIHGAETTYHSRWLVTFRISQRVALSVVCQPESSECVAREDLPFL